MVFRSVPERRAEKSGSTSGKKMQHFPGKAAGLFANRGKAFRREAQAPAGTVGRDSAAPPGPLLQRAAAVTRLCPRLPSARDGGGEETSASNVRKA